MIIKFLNISRRILWIVIITISLYSLFTKSFGLMTYAIILMIPATLIAGIIEFKEKRLAGGIISIFFLVVMILMLLNYLYL